MTASSFENPPPSPALLEAYLRAMAPFWHPLCPVAALGREPMPIELLGKRLAIVCLDGRIAVFSDLCPHLGAALSLGSVVKGRHLRCPYHGWSFDGMGRCVDIPARKGLSIPAATRAETFPSTEAHGLIWACLAPPARSPIPDFPELSDPQFHLGPWKEGSTWRASAPRVILSQLDDTHFCWVHPGTIGSATHPETPDHKVSRTASTVVSRFTVWQRAEAPSVGLGSATAEKDPLPVSYVIEAGTSSVHIRKQRKEAAFAVFQAVSPVRHDRCRVFWRIARTYDKKTESDPVHDRVQDAILEEDRKVVESQRPWLLPPISAGRIRYLGPCDLPLVEYHRWMEELGVPQL
ncbi:aromatic ring-hydroxylating oxygenase subunit alpha [Methylacidimicrobium tartarophylax]|uniref:Methylxanthine N1-demethylase NdmA n=1 Tax=Methylacidimicrobium tartarophylax TaxID=1041768 RepID=A0A5E6MFD4_9BACT|nr:aromatic ring-hydroxylating dioxygenase subunit alpha [Methylacidimicrobium tartarophylax]VVM08207.1 Methylxanthine N1-demethylase NdmA [Methylacidimicrobium tartarophylax]